jgi:predicted nucleotidyltransferase component of viral defense system
MIATRELRRLATRSGARQIRNVEIDIILTLLLQKFHERGLLEHLAFKGGTMLRKMVFGPPPAAIPSIALEEVLAEKIRAASQRSKIRDLYDLSESLNLEFYRPRVRGLAVLKLWSQRDSLNYAQLVKRIEEAADYDIADLTQLLRKDQRADLAVLIKRVVEGYRFLNNLTELESKLTDDKSRKAQTEADHLVASLHQMSPPG